MAKRAATRSNLRKTAPGIVSGSVGSVRTQIAKSVIARTLIGAAPQLQARRVKSEEELLIAYELLYREYRKRGLCAENETKLHFNRHHLLPDTRTYVLEWFGIIAGTISLFEDSPFGIPLEQTYPEEVARFRRRSVNIGEIGALALDTRMFSIREGCCTKKLRLRALMTLFYAMFRDVEKSSAVTDFLIVVHPRHEHIYTPLDFQRFADIRDYEGACGKPAVPLHNTVARLAKVATQLGFRKLNRTLPIVDEPFVPELSMLEKLQDIRPEVFKARKHYGNVH